MRPFRPGGLAAVARRLGEEAGRLRFRAASHVYNPLQYAWQPHREYLRRYGEGRGRVVLLGMNPGPWGMAQTGVPFGDIVMVRDWLAIEAPLEPRLPRQHPKYPILGFRVRRREGSGRRLWEWARDRYGSPERFFTRFFVWNYCPLLFIAGGRNLTPERLPLAQAARLTAASDRALADLVRILAPQAIIGIGRYAERQARRTLGDELAVAYLPHPSPASPAANRDWSGLADRALTRWCDG